MSDYPMLISNKLHSFRNFILQSYMFFLRFMTILFQEIKTDIKNPEKPIQDFSGGNH